MVIEIDGMHHYADGDRASSRLYAEMMREDRSLRLDGYEVVRFGGYDFCDAKQGQDHDARLLQARPQRPPLPYEIRAVTWRLRAVRAVARLTGRMPSRADHDRVLACRQALQPATTEEQWTISVEGCGFAATGPTGQRAVGLARGAAAAQELISAPSEPDAPPTLRWLTPRPPAPAGALMIYDEPPLGDIADFIAASSAQRDRLRRARTRTGKYLPALLQPARRVVRHPFRVADRSHLRTYPSKGI